MSEMCDKRAAVRSVLIRGGVGKMSASESSSESAKVCLKNR